MSDALPTALEKPKDRFICTPDRTHNRIRSPRLAASGPQNKVGKGSRQNRSVTSGKGLALRVGYEGVGFRDDGGYVRSGNGPNGRPLSSRDQQYPCTYNNQLRTGADKGNPTV